VLTVSCGPLAQEDSKPAPSPTHGAVTTPTFSPLNLYKNLPVRVVDREWTVEALLVRSKQEGSSVWADGEELTFFYQGEAESVRICCGIQLPMQRVGDSDVWALTVHVDELAEAAISYAFIPYEDGRPVEAVAGTAPSQVWRGPEAPPAPERAESLQGRIGRHVIDSTHLGEPRELTVYLPPDHDRTQYYPVAYAADGQAVEPFAAVLDPQVVDGNVPAVIVVGVHCAEGGGVGDAYDPDQDLRAQEYLLGDNQGRFEAHERFFVYEVSDWAARTLGASSDRAACAIFGFSNGGAFAVSMGIRHPERYGTVIAFSLGEGQQGWGTPEWTADAAPRHYLLAGTLEPFQGTTSRWAARLSRIGVEHVYRERVCGHDPVMWEEEFPRAVAWAFIDH
jgi:enterochelin esterase-like enzyme